MQNLKSEIYSGNPGFLKFWSSWKEGARILLKKLNKIKYF